MRPKIPALVIIASIAVYFFCLAGRGLKADFTPDDLMNCYRGFAHPLSHWLTANLLFFQPPTRPLGQLFYGLLFHFAGLNPLPYRIVCFAFMTANLWLTYLLASRLTGSRRVGSVASLLIAFHGSFGGLYYNTGTSYDVFCFFFYLTALLYYVRIRQAGGYPSWGQTALVVCLYVLALNSKEMAVTFPVMIGVFELVYYGRGGWLLRNSVLYSIGILTAIYIAVTSRGPDSLVALPSYHPHISAQAYLLTTRQYLNNLIYSVNGFDNVRTVALFSTLAAIAWLLRDRTLKFCWWFILIGALPIAFIDPRGLYAYYIPMAGLATFLAILIVKAVRRIENPMACAALFTACAATLAIIHVQNGALDVEHILAEQRHIRDVITQMQNLCPTLPKGGRILFIQDPFENMEWNSVFLVRLLYRDDSLEIDRVAMLKSPPAPAYEGYREVLTFENGKLRRLIAPRPELIGRM